MDEAGFERAQQLADWERADAIAAARRTVATPGQEECSDCGDLIPPERRRVAPFATRCMQCQSALEHQGRLGLRPLFGRPNPA